MLSTTDDLRIRELKELTTPQEVMREIPRTLTATRIVMSARNAIHAGDTRCTRRLIAPRVGPINAIRAFRAGRLRVRPAMTVPLPRIWLTSFNAEVAFPRANFCSHSTPPRLTRATRRSESAVTTEAPTPCNPPECEWPRTRIKGRVWLN